MIFWAHSVPNGSSPSKEFRSEIDTNGTSTNFIAHGMSETIVMDELYFDSQFSDANRAPRANARPFDTLKRHQDARVQSYIYH
jgi:hypothetical protein